MGVNGLQDDLVSFIILYWKMQKVDSKYIIIDSYVSWVVFCFKDIRHVWSTLLSLQLELNKNLGNASSVKCALYVKMLAML